MAEKDDVVNFSTTLSRKTKSLLERFCKKRGLRLNHLVEKAILELLEDEMDKEIIDTREFEGTVTWSRSA